MKAVVKFGRRDGEVELREVREPEIGERQVLLRVKAVGVCGSDIHMWRETHSWAIKTPLILGHEFSGVIERIGGGVENFKIGQRVTCETAARVCGHCLYCRTGEYNLCPERLGFGALIDGVMAEFAAVRPEIIHRLPDAVSFEQAALAEPVSVAVNALVENSRIKPGDTVVIQGAGTIGILCLQIARICGAGPILVLGADRDESRLRTARSLGAARAVNVQRENPLELMKSLGDGLGADLVVDCTGASAALRQSVDLVRPHGQITKIGWGAAPLDFSLDPLVQKAARIQASFSHTYPTWERVLGLMAGGQLNLGPVIGGVHRLEDWKTAFSDMESGKNIKSVLKI
ncbi:MAG: zinc-binding dehydrogenase [Planctomycetota bacterium]|jgi:alcohol dehydrogenase/L-iditol 2-dehydrogenase|nr:zinc-binding dehydrogenase [Planctomycetota bacterium]